MVARLGWLSTAALSTLAIEATSAAYVGRYQYGFALRDGITNQTRSTTSATFTESAIRSSQVPPVRPDQTAAAAAVMESVTAILLADSSSPSLSISPSSSSSSKLLTPPAMRTRPPQTAVEHTIAVTLDLGSANPTTDVVGVGGGIVWLEPSSSLTSATDYIDPNDLGASGGPLTTVDTGVPTRTVAPTRTSIGANTRFQAGPPPADTESLPTSSETLFATSTKTRPPIMPGSSDTTMSVGADATSLATGSPANSASSPTATSTRFVTKPPKGPPPPAGTSRAFGNGTTQTIDLGGINTLPPERDPDQDTITANPTKADVDTHTISYCQESDRTKLKTSYSIVYTSTVTFYGNPSDYHAPYPPLITPATCVDAMSPYRMTISVCFTASSKVSCSTTLDWAPITYTHASDPVGTITFVTTDKNPAVVWSTISTPLYGVTRSGSKPQDLHNTMTENIPIVTPNYSSPGATKDADLASQSTPIQSSPGGGKKQLPDGNGRPTSDTNGSPGDGDQSPPRPTPTPPPITIVPQPSGVVVDGTTYNDVAGSPTQKIVIGDETVVINPSQIVGAGVTIDRQSVAGGIFVAQPTSTNVGGIQVELRSSVAVVDGTSFILAQTPITTTVQNQAVVIGPSGVAVGSVTIPVTAVPLGTQVVVAGGDLITALGQSVLVIKGTTITYGPSVPPGTTVVDGESIIYGPMGVIVHNTTLGGGGVQSTETQYEIIGGATLTELGPSMVVVGDKTYTIGPGTGSTTTVFRGQTVTIGPSGVTMSSLTLTYPFGPTITLTPGAKATATTPGATVATARTDEGRTSSTTSADGPPAPTPSKDAAVLGAGRPWIGSVLCIAIGVVAFHI